MFLFSDPTSTAAKVHDFMAKIESGASTNSTNGAPTASAAATAYGGGSGRGGFGGGVGVGGPYSATPPSATELFQWMEQRRQLAAAAAISEKAEYFG